MKIITLVAGSCSGKSTVADILKEKIEKEGLTKACPIFRGDLFYNTQKRDEMVNYNTSAKIGYVPSKNDFDDLTIFNIRGCCERLKQLKDGNKITMPTYSYKYSDEKRETIAKEADGSGEKINSADVVILDAVFSPEIIEHLVKNNIFTNSDIILLHIDSNPDIAIQRRKERSSIKESDDAIEGIKVRAKICHDWCKKNDKNYQSFKIENNSTVENLDNAICDFVQQVKKYITPTSRRNQSSNIGI